MPLCSAPLGAELVSSKKLTMILRHHQKRVSGASARKPLPHIPVVNSSLVYPFAVENDGQMKGLTPEEPLVEVRLWPENLIQSARGL